MDLKLEIVNWISIGCSSKLKVENHQILTIKVLRLGTKCIVSVER